MSHQHYKLTAERCVTPIVTATTLPYKAQAISRWLKPFPDSTITIASSASITQLAVCTASNHLSNLNINISIELLHWSSTHHTFNDFVQKRVQDRFSRLRNVMHLLYIMNCYCCPPFVGLAMRDYYWILTLHTCGNRPNRADERRTRSINGVLPWCCLVKQNTEECRNWLCHENSSNMGCLPGQHSRNQVGNDNLIELAPASGPVGGRITLPVLPNVRHADFVEPDYVVSALQIPQTTEDFLFDSSPRVAHDVYTLL